MITTYKRLFTGIGVLPISNFVGTLDNGCPDPSSGVRDDRLIGRIFCNDTKLRREEREYMYNAWLGGL